MLRRRKFLSLFTLTAAAAAVNLDKLAGLLGITKSHLRSALSFDFHVFDDNLTNLHFYFINAKVSGDKLVKERSDKAYMVVRLPQQHISEQEFREKTISDTTIALSKLSGFSYLAFEVFPNRTDTRKSRRPNFPFNLDNLLRWDNPDYYRLITTPNVRPFNANSYTAFMAGSEAQVDGDSLGSNFDLYGRVCEQLFNGDPNVPVTLLEIPQGLFLTPYLREKQDKVNFLSFDIQKIEKDTYLFKDKNVPTKRKVEEIWHASLQEVTTDKPDENGKTPPAQISQPVFRAVGYLKDSTLPNTIWLPTPLDKKTIVYLTSLARKNAAGDPVNREENYDINSENVCFTGLGVTTKLHYKNLQPPNEVSLAEYEHHITLGRDEFVRVAEIGVISATAQKALYVRLGKRKIVNGISYVEFKEYIEIVEQEILFYDTSLFDHSDAQLLKTGEPSNFINARKVSENSAALTYNGSFHDNLFLTIKRRKDQKPVIYKDDPKATVPGAQDTHFRRYPFKKIKAVTLKSPPIKTEIVLGTDADKKAFWPVHEKDETKDLNFEFIATDWDDKEVKIRAPFLWIKKSVVDSQIEAEIQTIYNAFFLAETAVNPTDTASLRNISRRKLAMGNQHIAFTIDDQPKDKNAQGQEKNELSNKSNIAATEFLEYYFSIAKDQSAGQSIFNGRAFPLYPQLRKAKVYLENIRAYSAVPLPSVIDYNEDYIFNAFKRGTFAGQVLIPFNKTKVIFNHTRDFLANIDDDVQDGYKRIRDVFGGAGDRIGGLVNPDIDIEAIGLVKQGISVAKNLNEKYKGPVSKITRFNPRDLLRGNKAELFGGISLIDILEDVLPEGNTPLFQVKQLQARLEELQNSPVITDLKEKFQEARKLLKDVRDKIEAIKTTIKTAQSELNKQKELLLKNKYEDVLAIARAYTDQGKIFMVLKDDLSVDLVKGANFLTTEIVSSIEKMEMIREWFKKVTDATRMAGYPAEIRTFITKAQTHFNTEFFDVVVKDYPVYNTLNSRVKDYLNAQVTNYNTFTSKLVTLSAKQLALMKAEAGTNEYNQALTAYSTTKNEVDAARKAVSKRLNEYWDSLDKFNLFTQNKPQWLEFSVQLSSIYELLIKLQLPFYLKQLEQTTKDIDSFISKFPASGADGLNLQTLFGTGRALLVNLRGGVIEKYTEAITGVQTSYESARANGVNQLIAAVNNSSRDYQRQVEQKLDDFFEKSAIQKHLKTLKEIEKSLVQYANELENKTKEYEDLAKKQLQEKAEGLVNQVTDYLKIKEEELRQSVDEVQARKLIENIKEIKRILQLITAVSKQDVVYTWNTKNFKDRDFGVFGFRRSTNPATEMSVYVINTLHFNINRFPAVVEKATYHTENRISNFSISLLKAITLSFKEVSFVSGSNRPSKFNVQISDVKFGGAFSFVQAFEKYFKSLLGDAFRLRMYPTSVNIGYTLPIPDIKTPSFNFFNLTLNLDFWLYFDRNPMKLIFSLARPEKKFTMTAGIYAGFGYFAIEANPKEGIRAMEVALEFGGYFGLSLGPLRGEVKLAVGLFYRKDPSGVVMAGYFICEGRAKLWFVMISVRFYMGVISRGNYVEGRCTVTYSIRLGRFFKKSFTASYYKKLAGATPANNQQGSQEARREISSYSMKLLNDRDRAIAAEDEFIDMHLFNSFKREVNNMSFAQWKEFIESYI